MHHYRQQTWDQIQEKPNPPPSSELPEDLRHWSEEGHLQEKYLHNTLLSHKLQDGASFNLLLILEQ